MKNELIKIVALINSTDGKHLVIQRVNEFCFPGDLISEEHPSVMEFLVNTIKAQTGLEFEEEDFELINAQKFIYDVSNLNIFTYACKKHISDSTKLKSSFGLIKPIFLSPSSFYSLTYSKEYYLGLFEIVNSEEV